VKGQFFLYITHDNVPMGDPGYQWGATQYNAFEDAVNAAKHELKHRPASKVDIFQLVGTAEKGIVIS